MFLRAQPERLGVCGTDGLVSTSSEARRPQVQLIIPWDLAVPTSWGTALPEDAADLLVVMVVVVRVAAEAEAGVSALIEEDLVFVLVLVTALVVTVGRERVAGWI